MILEKLSSNNKQESQEAESEIMSNPSIFKKELLEYLNGSTKDPNNSKALAKVILLLGVMRERQALKSYYKLVLCLDLSLELRARVIRAISEIVDSRDVFDESAIEIFESLAKSSENSIRGFSAKIFENLEGTWAMSKLNELSRDSDAWVRQKASEALAAQLLI